MGLIESAQERMLANDQRSVDILKKAIQLNKDAALNDAGRNEVAEALNMSLKEFNKEYDDANDKQEFLNNKLKEAQELLEAQKRTAKALNTAFGSLAAKVGITNNSFSKGLKSIGQMATDFQKMGDGKFIKNVVASAAEVFSFSNVLGSLLQKTFEMAMATDKMGASIQKATGIAGGFRKELSSQIGAATDAGVEFSKLGASYQAITTGLIGATADSTGLRKELGMQITQFEQFGVSVDDSVAILNTLSTTMNTDMIESMEIMKDLTMSATQLGVGPKKMAEDFKKASASLAVHGKKSVEVFKGLAVAARNAGTSVDSLVSIAEKFDTFESAADTAGKLNSILGATMSATEMLMMTEDERIETLIGTVQASGRAFNEMNRFEQKAIANAAGINNMAEANRIFGMSLDAYKQQNAEAQASADAQEKFNKAIDGVLPLMTRLSIELQRIGDNEEMINGFIAAFEMGLSAVAFIMEMFSTTTGKLGIFIGVLALKMVAAAGSGVSFGLGMKAAGVGSMAAGKGGRLGAVGIRAMGMSMAQAAAAGFPFVGIVLALSVPILAVGAAALAAGYGIMLAFEGLASFITAFGNLDPLAMIASAIAVGLLGKGFLVLAGALMTLANPITGAGVLVFSQIAISAGILAGGIGLLLSGLADFTTRTVEPMFASAEAALEVADAVEKISTAIEKVPDKKLFSATLENIALITTGKSAGITQATEAVADRISNISATLKNNMQITLSVDGKELKTYIEQVVNGQDGTDPVFE